MGFFSNIFKRKEGGTVVGNLLRSASNALPFGLGTVYQSTIGKPKDSTFFEDADERGILPPTGGTMTTSATPGLGSGPVYSGGDLPQVTVTASPAGTAETWTVLGISLPAAAKWPVLIGVAYAVYHFFIRPQMGGGKKRY